MNGTPRGDGLPDATRVGRTALRVTDLDDVTEFYRSVVGLRVLARDDAAATLGVPGTPLLELRAAPSADPRGPAAAGLFHTAFRVPSRAALGDALARIRDRWRLDGASDHRVSEALHLTDPEGNEVEVYRDFPREEWPRTDDGTPRLGTDPLDLAALEAAAAGDDAVPPGTDVGHVHLEVSSLPAARAFYADDLGFDVVQESPGALFVSAGGYHHHVAANTWRGRTEAARGRGLAWFELVVPDGEALAAVRDRLAAADHAPVDTRDGFEVRDPDDVAVRFRAEP